MGHNRHSGHVEPPSRYDRYPDYGTGTGLRYGGGSDHYASSPSGLNSAGFPGSHGLGRQNRGVRDHYASTPGLSRQVRFRRDEKHRSLSDLRDIEESIQDIGLSLRDIKSISQSIKDMRNIPGHDEEVIEV